MYISGTAEAGFDAPAIARMLVGVKISNNGTNPQYMTGDIAEMMYVCPLNVCALRSQCACMCAHRRAVCV